MRIPIRLKIVGLIATTLVISLLSYLLLGTSLFIQDKTSYIYDFKMNELRTFSDLAELKLQQAIQVGQVIAKIPPQQPVFLDTMSRLGIHSLHLLRASSPEKFQVEQSWGSESALPIPQWLDRLNWTPPLFDQNAVLMGDPDELRLLPVGYRAIDPTGRPVAMLMFFQLDIPQEQTTTSESTTLLFDSKAKVVFSKPATTDSGFISSVKTLSQSLPPGRNTSGAVRWTIKGADYIVCYRRIFFGNQLLLTAVPTSLAFSATKTLIFRSIMTGISILLLASGFALIFAKGITARLREMWFATQKVIEGDFSVRTTPPGRIRDELSGLSTSFNLMAGKIDELMSATAEKARMEKELETARAFQSGFFPRHNFTSDNFLLAGKYVPATECAGDWWHYAQVGKELLIALGDVTGHGVSSALLAAHVHGSMNRWLRETRERNIPLHLDKLLEEINQAVLDSGKGNAYMTFLALTLNLETGSLVYANAGHPPPLIYRPKQPTSFLHLTEERGTVLGLQNQFSCPTGRLQLQSADSLILHTDGVFAPRIFDATPLRIRVFLDELEKNLQDLSCPPEQICTHMLAYILQYMHQGSQTHPDDITLLIGRIPGEFMS